MDTAVLQGVGDLVHGAAQTGEEPEPGKPRKPCRKGPLATTVECLRAHGGFWFSNRTPQDRRPRLRLMRPLTRRSFRSTAPARIIASTPSTFSHPPRGLSGLKNKPLRVTF